MCLLFLYVCFVYTSVCFPASSQTCARPYTDRSGSALAEGKEVRLCIDKAVNEVIGGINGDPQGNSEHFCLLLCLSVCVSVWRSGERPMEAVC